LVVAVVAVCRTVVVGCGGGRSSMYVEL